ISFLLFTRVALMLGASMRVPSDRTAATSPRGDSGAPMPGSSTNRPAERGRPGAGALLVRDTAARLPDGGRHGMSPGVTTALPIDPLIPEVVSLPGRANRLVLRAAPGAGKTTRVPAALLDAGVAGRRHVAVV